MDVSAVFSVVLIWSTYPGLFSAQLTKNKNTKQHLIGVSRVFFHGDGADCVFFPDSSGVWDANVGVCSAYEAKASCIYDTVDDDILPYGI